MQCCVPGCSAPIWVLKHKLCSRHYNRARTTGTVVDGPRSRASPVERFWRNVSKRGTDECWPWIGKAKVDGYGYLGLGGREYGKILAHRASWHIHHGRIPNSAEYHGTVVRHKCDNRLCVNPAHLELGTQSDNVRDMIDRGKMKLPGLKGEAHGMSRFTEDDIRYMRASTKSIYGLAKEFGCPYGVIYPIIKRKTWKHVT